MENKKCSKPLMISCSPNASPFFWGMWVMWAYPPWNHHRPCLFSALEDLWNQQKDVMFRVELLVYQRNIRGYHTLLGDSDVRNWRVSWLSSHKCSFSIAFCKHCHCRRCGETIRSVDNFPNGKPLALSPRPDFTQGASHVISCVSEKSSV